MSKDKNNKKICILTSVHPPFDTRIFYKEVQTLANNGYNITLIAPYNRQKEVDGIKFILLNRVKSRLVRFIKMDYIVYKKALFEKADIYHFHDPELIPWMLLLKIRTNTQIIYDVHEDIPKQIISKNWLLKLVRKPISLIFNFIEKRLATKLPLSEIDR